MNYSTTFALTENPISEGGSWENTVSATWTAPVITSGGNATGPASTGVNDAVARLTGTWGADQTISGVAFVGGAFAGAPEIELHLRMTMDPDNGIHVDHINTYEIDIIPTNGIYVVRWEGGQGNLSVIGSPVVIGAVADGDVFEASITGPGSNCTIVVKKNGSTLMSVTDNDGLGYSTGNPGIGLDAGSAADGAKFGWQSISATDGLSTQPIGRGML